MPTTISSQSNRSVTYTVTISQEPHDEYIVWFFFCRDGVYPHPNIWVGLSPPMYGGLYSHPNIWVGLSLLLSLDIFLWQRRKRRKEADTASERKYKRMQSACRVRPLWPSVKNICPCGRPQTSSYLNYCGRPQGPHPAAVRHHALNGYLTASEADFPVTPG